jgi:hypothetical protein
MAKFAEVPRVLFKIQREYKRQLFPQVCDNAYFNQLQEMKKEIRFYEMFN